jgi:hypothetical protein
MSLGAMVSTVSSNSSVEKPRIRCTKKWYGQCRYCSMPEADRSRPSSDQTLLPRARSPKYGPGSGDAHAAMLAMRGISTSSESRSRARRARRGEPAAGRLRMRLAGDATRSGVPRQYRLGGPPRAPAGRRAAARAGPR